MRFSLSALMRVVLLMAAGVCVAGRVHAGGPKFVAGTSFFDPTVVGQPLRWANGAVSYRVDQGALNATVDQATATAMVDAAAGLWSKVATAAVQLTKAGTLAEDVSGANATATGGVLTAPTDVAPAAAGIGVVFDADGAVIDALYGTGASDPTGCQNSGVFFWLDRLNTNASFAHGLMVLNGRCATSPERLSMMSFQIERGFGRLLGLDFSQVNPGALQTGVLGATDGWPIMQPSSGLCGPFGGVCLPNPDQLRYDDIAALSRLYPVTAANQGSFTGKQLTAAQTIALSGTIRFATGVGMQGVNVVARPFDASGNPLYQYTVTAVSGALFNGNHGNPVTGRLDEQGNPLTRWGSDDATLQGAFDLSGILLPPGMTAADYQISFEPIDVNWIQNNAVGPYLMGAPVPSGTLNALRLTGLTAGTAKTLTIEVSDSAVGGDPSVVGTESAPRMLPASGQWFGRLGQVGQTDWFQFPMRRGRMLTVSTLALDESYKATGRKAMPALGAWDGFDTTGSDPVGAGVGLNGWTTGQSWLQISALADTQVRLGIADQRGDGRPDYPYQGWVLYADSVAPQRLPAAGGTIVIRGMGFRPQDTVLVGGQAAQVVSIAPNEITAIAPATLPGVTGSVDVEVDDEPAYYSSTIIADGLSYDAGLGDALTMLNAPAATVPIGVPVPFTVQALGADLQPAPGVTVTFTRLSGKATQGCGATVCTLTADGDGQASLNVTATDSAVSIVTASLSNGSTIQTEFSGGTPPKIAALAPSSLSVAAGAIVQWTVQALALSSGSPAAGQSILWQPATGIAVSGGAVTTNTAGIAAQQLTVGPLNAGHQSASQACLNGTSQCAAFTVLGARPEYAQLEPLSGTVQTLAAQATPAAIILRLLDMNGNPMAGGSVTLYQTLYAWAPPCAPHGRCPQPPLLATQSSTTTSDLNGIVQFAPLAHAGVATTMAGVAVSGDTAALSVALEQHP